MTAPAQLYFIYDCLCPWSYVTTPLIDEVHQKLAEQVEIIWLNNARYEGGELPKLQHITQVEAFSELRFTQAYKKSLSQPQESVLTANLMTWVSRKTPQTSLTLLKALQKQLFEDGQTITTKNDLGAIIDQLKLFPPAKIMKNDVLSKDAQFDLAEIAAIQEIIGTDAIPALLLAVGNNLVLLNHNLYLNEPSAIVDAIKIELNKH